MEQATSNDNDYRTDSDENSAQGDTRPNNEAELNTEAESNRVGNVPERQLQAVDAAKSTELAIAGQGRYTNITDRSEREGPTRLQRAVDNESERYLNALLELQDLRKMKVATAQLDAQRAIMESAASLLKQLGCNTRGEPLPIPVSSPTAVTTTALNRKFKEVDHFVKLAKVRLERIQNKEDGNQHAERNIKAITALAEQYDVTDDTTLVTVWRGQLDGSERKFFANTPLAHATWATEQATARLRYQTRADKFRKLKKLTSISSHTEVETALWILSQEWTINEMRAALLVGTFPTHIQDLWHVDNRYSEETPLLSLLSQLQTLVRAHGTKPRQATKKTYGSPAAAPSTSNNSTGSSNKPASKQGPCPECAAAGRSGKTCWVMHADHSNRRCRRCQELGHVGPLCPTNPDAMKSTRVLLTSAPGAALCDKVFDRPPLLLPVTIEGQPVVGLVDSGADHTVIDNTLRQKLAIPLIPSANFAAVSASGNALTTHGLVDVNITCGALVDVRVRMGVCDLAKDTPLLIGRDLLGAVGVKITLPGVVAQRKAENDVPLIDNYSGKALVDSVQDFVDAAEPPTPEAWLPNAPLDPHGSPPPTTTECVPQGSSSTSLEHKPADPSPPEPARLAVDDCESPPPLVASGTSSPSPEYSPPQGGSSSATTSTGVALVSRVASRHTAPPGDRTPFEPVFAASDSDTWHESDGLFGEPNPSTASRAASLLERGTVTASQVRQHAAATVAAPPPARLLRVADRADEPILAGASDAFSRPARLLGPAPAAEQAQVVAAAQAPLARNQAIPDEAICPLPEAVVSFDVEGDPAPVYVRQYPVAATVRPAIDLQVAEWVRTGVVEKGDPASPHNTPIFAVAKKSPEGVTCSWRIVHDFSSTLNAHLRPRNVLPLTVPEIWDRLRSATIISCIDVEAAFTRLLIREEDRDRTTFRWGKWGALRCRRALFGSASLPSWWQAVIDKVLAPLSHMSVAYADDVLIFSKTADEHCAHIAQVLDALTAANLKVKLSKCSFGFTALRVLGHIFSPKFRRLDPLKAEAALLIPRPTKGKEVRSLLGLASWLRDYLPNFQRVFAPLQRVQNIKDVAAIWDDELEESYQMARRAFKNPVTLSVPPKDAYFILSTDGCLHGVGAVLQWSLDGSHPGPCNFVGFFAKSLSPTQSRYGVSQIELLAIILAVEFFRDHLYGRRFLLRTDNRGLTFLGTHRYASAMFGRWYDRLSMFSYSVDFVPGVDNVLADLFSRVGVAVEPQSAGPMTAALTALLPSTASVRALTRSAARKAAPTLLTSDAPKASTLPSSSIEAVEALTQRRLPPEDERRALIERTHAVGHFGAEHVFHHLWHTELVFWPSMKTDVRRLVAGCRACLQHNVKQRSFEPMQSIEAQLPGQIQAMDLAGPFRPSAEGHVYVLLVIDVATKYLFLRALKNKTARSVGGALIQIWSDFGAPEQLLSDQGSEFANRLVRSLTTAAGVTHKFSSVQHSSAMGLIERQVRLTKQALYKSLRGDFLNFHSFLPGLQAAINGKRSRTTKSSAFHLMFGRPQFFQAGKTTGPPISPAALEARWKIMADTVWPAVAEQVSEHRSRRNRKADSSRRTEPTPLRRGALVMLRDVYRSRGSAVRQLGPFTVAWYDRERHHYLLFDATKTLLSRTFPREFLTLVPAEADIDTKSESFEVERILQHRGAPGNWTYLVKWMGYDDDANSWVHQDAFDTVDIIESYWLLRNTAPDSDDSPPHTSS